MNVWETDLFFGAVGPLFGDDADAVVAQDADAEDGDAAAVDELHRLHGQHRGDDVVRVVLPARHCAHVRPTFRSFHSFPHDKSAGQRMKEGKKLGARGDRVALKGERMG